MKKIIIIFLFVFSHHVMAQKADLARSFFFKGDYEKAIVLYIPLHEKNPIRRDYFKNLLTCYQQVEKFDYAESLVRDQLKKFPSQVYLNIEIGYNYQLQDQIEKAKSYYEKSLKFIQANPNFGFSIGQSFKQNHLLDYALRAYQIAKANNPKLNTEISEAQIYGEKGDLEKMFIAYLDLVEKNEKYYATVQRYIANFITDDSQNETNILFKNLLLKRAQNNPNDSWNILLSWVYMQQKNYNKALIQEKSLFRRNSENLDRIIEIGLVSFANKDYPSSINAFGFILKNTQQPEIILRTQLNLLEIDRELASTKKELLEIDKKFEELLTKYGKNKSTIDLQTSYADFLSFTLDQPDKAIEILQDALPLSNSKFQNGTIQLKLADIMVYTNQFNQALILYSQIQTDLKNSVLAQTARFKVAQTSYFKGDFKWAQNQLKVLKSSTSQFIANDALELNLLIANNIENDSLPEALLLYAKADLLVFQNKKLEAIDTLQDVLVKFKGQSIEDDALNMQAKLFTKLKKYTQAERNYIKIIEIDQEGILKDDAYFNLAELYNNHLNNKDKAMEMYQKIIFEHPSSIFLIESRKKYRKLRGDTT